MIYDEVTTTFRDLNPPAWPEIRQVHLDNGHHEEFLTRYEGEVYNLLFGTSPPYSLYICRPGDKDAIDFIRLGTTNRADKEIDFSIDRDVENVDELALKIFAVIFMERAL